MRKILCDFSRDVILIIDQSSGFTASCAEQANSYFKWAQTFFTPAKFLTIQACNHSR